MSPFLFTPSGKECRRDYTHGVRLQQQCVGGRLVQKQTDLMTTFYLLAWLRRGTRLWILNVVYLMGTVC
jgi:hypothetical protein